MKKLLGILVLGCVDLFNLKLSIYFIGSFIVDNLQ
jgi:hypothetical protein